MDDGARDRLFPRRPLIPAFILLLLDEAPGHGYELSDRLKGVGFELADRSPVYRELRALEKHGLVRSLLAPHESGPVPKVYQLTAAGREALDYSVSAAASVGDLVTLFRRRYRPRR